jgi:hypothetical protein
VQNLPEHPVGGSVLLKSLRTVAAAFCHLLVWCCVATALPIDDSSPDSGKRLLMPSFDSPSPRVEESEPPIYYLPDKQGNLQPVLDFKYQDFIDLYRLKNELDRRNQPPRFTLQRMSIAGTADQTRAELTVQLQVATRDDQWVRVPLRLGQGLLRGPVQYKGSGKQLVQYDGEATGYVCWIRGKPDAPHEITLTLFVPLETVGEETRLKVSVPRATASELKLSVPIVNAEGTVSEGTTLLSSVAKQGGTEFSIVGLGAVLQMAWHKSDSAAEAPAVLDAVGSVLAKLDGRTISTEATLSVRSHGSAFDRFTVHLPPDAEFVAGKPSGYVVMPLEEAKTAGARSVEVRLPKKTVGPVEVRLNCRRAYEPDKNAGWCELAGFEVVGAARQWGTLAVSAGCGWQVLWGPSREVRQLDSLPSGLRKDDAVAAFEYSCQPYSLSVKMAPRKTRINVEPDYVLLVDRNRVRLEGKLLYTVRGAAVSTLEIELPGWELEGAGPEGLVAVDGLTIRSGVVSIPLRSPASGSVEVQLRAHRSIDAKATSLVVPLPRPQGAVVGSAAVVVLAADNVELLPNARATTGLVRQRTLPAMKLPARQQDAICYRGVGGDAVFAAGFRVHPQRIATDARSEVLLADNGATVEQKFSYSIAYEPVEHLTIAVPRELETKRIQVRIDGGKPISPLVTPRDHVGDAATTALARLLLPEPRIGECEVTLRYSIPLSGGDAASDPIAIPLLMPEDGDLLANELTVFADKDTHVSPRKGAWTPADRDTADVEGQSGLLLTASQRLNSVELDRHCAGNGRSPSTVVERAWIQSWLTSAARQDRAVFQLSTERKSLDVILPAGAETAQATVKVNGLMVEPQVRGENKLSIPLPAGHGERRCVVELRYHFTTSRPSWGAARMEFPRLVPQAWVERLYWQVVLPANEHLVATPRGFTGEFDWQWEDWFWGRVPLLDQEQLESWAGATPCDDLPGRANVYLFSALGNVEGAVLRTTGRTWIVLLASGAALVVGLLLIYVRVSRHPATLLAMAVALFAAGLIAPEPTLLLAQAACLGLVLTLLAGMLERGVARRRRAAARQEHSSPRIEASSIHTGFRPAPAVSSVSTEATQPIPPPTAGKTEP